MLMPSAFSCDASQQHYQSYPHTRLQSALFASPPASPPTLASAPAIGNIFNTCRSLQSLLTTPPPPERAQLTQLPTPPMAHAPSPIKLRLRPRAPRPDNSSAPDSRPRKKIVKRAPPRGANKRRRGADDDLGRMDLTSDDDSDNQIEADSESDADVPAMPAAPSTPKRARIAPEVIPLGLARTDYHNLHAASDTNRPLLNLAQGSGVEVERDGEHWSTEDDRILVELVLEKLRLSKTEWQDCARSLGKDRNSLSRRWRSLMAQGDVGLKPTRASRRGKLHGTW
ncbi:hypothetical protein D7B24_008381 [Verticillium nonalfalfae]|uniref:Myb-like domain-containing protein n=1 Tax=Verticillium nonalfalfae TaxID=1051616 RepID=A0A3M9Y777_9PEZI|nr:uncharacterized protein D7B24_008381 [Verticillium nonalfalfae]RNJ55596.1 hypothetical protein D7B24_008381 [Verticillium nonalfalfae]